MDFQEIVRTIKVLLNKKRLNYNTDTELFYNCLKELIHNLKIKPSLTTLKIYAEQEKTKGFQFNLKIKRLIGDFLILKTAQKYNSGFIRDITGDLKHRKYLSIKKYRVIDDLKPLN